MERKKNEISNNLSQYFSAVNMDIVGTATGNQHVLPNNHYRHESLLQQVNTIIIVKRVSIAEYGKLKPVRLNVMNPIKMGHA